MAFNINQPYQNQVQNQLTPQMPFQPTPINPQGFTNQNNINGVFGQQNPGTFTRSMQSPLSQTIDMSAIPTPSTMDPSLQAQAENVMAQTGIPQQPPLGVQQPTTPPYDLSY
jgi:hypothetical protein